MEEEKKRIVMINRTPDMYLPSDQQLQHMARVDKKFQEASYWFRRKPYSNWTEDEKRDAL